ncbi:unnamed protein product, partial [Didymodactylos carnosus]
MNLLPLTCIFFTVFSKRVVCYYTNWAGYRPGKGKFSKEDIDPNLCTHIIYSFAQVSGNSLATYDGSDNRKTSLKALNPDLKVILAVGGWNHGSQPFTQMVATPQSRTEFVKNSYNFIKEHGFDGLDLDWEYPADRGSPPEDRERFTLLAKELSEKYKPEGLLLSAAVPATPWRYDASYEPQVYFVNLMTYDFTGGWEATAGHNSPLTSQKQTVNNMLSKPDCTADKLNLGMASYGNSAIGGPQTGESGFLSYYEVCDKLKAGWTEKWSDQHSVPYAYSGSDWVGYDNRESIALK